jgi:hypothetical protein
MLESVTYRVTRVHRMAVTVCTVCECSSATRRQQQCGALQCTQVWRAKALTTLFTAAAAAAAAVQAVSVHRALQHL